MQNQEIQMQLNQIWNGWKLIQLIGEGSFGTVFRIECEESGHKHVAALKVITISQNQADDDASLSNENDGKSSADYLRDVVESIEHEIGLIADLRDNPTIVRYEDYAVIPMEGASGWNIFIRMEYLTPLLTYFKTQKVTLREILNLGIDMCLALEACQKHSIVHCDIKPENIFVSQSGRYKLVDFGIARKMEKITGNFLRNDTLNYMAPEVYSESNYSVRSDLYAVSMILYRFLNNNRGPFLPPHPEKISFSIADAANMKRINGAQLTPPANARGGIENVILKACTFAPEYRFADASQMRRALSSLLNGESVESEEEEHIASGTSDTEETKVGVRKGRSQTEGVISIDLAGEQEKPEASKEADAGVNSSQSSKRRMSVSNDVLMGNRPKSADTGPKGKTPSSAQAKTPDSGTNVAKPKINNAADGNRQPTTKEKGNHFVAPVILIAIVLAGIFGFFLLQSSGKVKVPELIGLQFEDAVNLASANGLSVVAAGEEYSEAAQGTILFQSPGSEALIEKGGALQVVVSKGSSPVVPSLIGLDRTIAREMVESAGFVYVEDDATYSDTVPEGVIISQDETEGTYLEPGQEICVVVSLGTGQLEVPDLSGMTLEEAKLTLEGLGFTCEVSEEHSATVEQGTVIRQEVVGDAVAQSGSVVMVVVSLGPEEDDELDFNYVTEELTEELIEEATEEATEHFAVEVPQQTTQAPRQQATQAPKKKTTEAPRQQTTQAPKKKTTEAPKKKSKGDDPDIIFYVD